VYVKRPGNVSQKDRCAQIYQEVMMTLSVAALVVDQKGRSMPRPILTQYELEPLVRAASANDDGAWAELVERFDQMLRTIVRSYRLSPADVDDVLQAVWLHLHRQLGRLRHPHVIPNWLATTARRESMRVLHSQVREQLTDDPDLLGGTDFSENDAELLAAERRAVLGRALETLPASQRRLMLVFAAAPAADYREISALLDMPMGSIGPTRARGLASLQRHPELRELHFASG
jgi:RNA polymerase sigma factor (sigma-70 family)